MTISQLCRRVDMYACLLFLISGGASAQHDTVEFKLIPKFYPDRILPTPPLRPLS